MRGFFIFNIFLSLYALFINIKLSSMKKIIFLIFIVFYLFSCSNNDPKQKVENEINEYLSKNLDEYSSYESVEFGELDTLWNENRKQIGWHIFHTYRCNIDGVKNTTTTVFTFDDKFENINVLK
jgi:PBP1b-binding outer membrane lipoprotein LpoB